MNLATTRLPELVQILHSSLAPQPVIARGTRWIVVEYCGWIFCHTSAPVGVDGPFPDLYAVVTERGRSVRNVENEWIWDEVRWRAEDSTRTVAQIT